MIRTAPLALAASLLFSTPALAADAAAGLKPGQTFKDCADCQTMVVVPAGTFTMGSTPAEREREGVPPSFGDHEGPTVVITIAKPFAIASTETTRAQFALFVKATNRPVPTVCANYNPEQDNWAGKEGQVANWQNPGFKQEDTHPVVCMSYNDAADYAAWMSQKTGHHYHVASEAQWEYVARAGTKTTRYWGDTASIICKKANVMTTATFAAINSSEGWMDEQVCASDKAWTVPVASYDANPWGVYDMLGSVWEWVDDCATPDHTGMPTDGSARRDGDCSHRISKGGAFHSRVWLARPATRGGGQPGVNRPAAAGIRIVRDID